MRMICDALELERGILRTRVSTEACPWIFAWTSAMKKRFYHDQSLCFVSRRVSDCRAVLLCDAVRR